MAWWVNAQTGQTQQTSQALAGAWFGPFPARSAATAWYSSTGGTKAPGKRAGSPAGSLAQQFVDELHTLIGDPYVYGAAGPAAFDCSGLVKYGLSKVGITAPRTSEAQWGWVRKITRAQLQPGDLIFEQWPGDSAAPGHVVIYAGGGQVIEAPQPGQPVHLRPWSPGETTIIGYGRPPGLTGTAAPAGGSGGFSLLSLALPADLLQMFSTLELFFTKILWVINPENVARVIAGVTGAFLAVFGIGFLVAAGA